MLQRRRVTHDGQPIFFDPTGRRGMWILVTLSMVFMLLGLLAAWLTPKELSPLWTVQQNKSINYPKELTESGEKLPILGDESYDVLTRIDLVQRSWGVTYLTDPFTGAVLRRATDDELPVIGVHGAVIEHYGRLADHQIALTFDDGPSAEYTPQLLDILSKNHVPATFFNIGVNVLQDPAVTARLVREGHMLGNHTLSHIEFDNHGVAYDREQLIGTDRIFRDEASYQTRIWRLPYGNDDDNPMALLMAQQLGYVHVGFNLDTNDWHYKPTQTIPVPALDGRGYAVLMHDGGGNRQQTLVLVQKFIDEARAQGYTFVTVGPLLAKPQLPVKITPTWNDHVSTFGLWLVMYGWREALLWLMRYGIVSAVVVSLVYIILALIRHRQAGKMTWPDRLELPPVSVILPLYNEERVIAKTLQRLAETTHPDFEVIAVVNGCTDGTKQIAAIYAHYMPWLRVIESEKGKHHALTAGLKAARHEVVVFIDGDTLVEPDMVTKLARHFTDDRVGAVAGHVKVGNRRGLLARFQALEYLTGICVTRMAEGVLVAPGACSAARKSAIVRAGGFTSDTLAEDCDLTVRLRRAGWLIRQDNEAVAYTEVPQTLKVLWGQRVRRWKYGTLQVLWKNRGMMLRPRYGWFGVYVMPNAVVSSFLSLLFLPLMYGTVVLNCMTGNWHNTLLFSALALGINLALTLTAVCMVRERLSHLWAVPPYMVLYVPLQIIMLGVTVVKVVIGRAMQWYAPERTDSVPVPAPA